MGYYFVSVAFNKAGMKELDEMVEHSENCETYIIPEDEYNALWKANVFNVINSRYGLMIDHDESEKVSAEQLEAVYDAINVVPGVFMNAVNLAIKFKTKIHLDF